MNIIALSIGYPLIGFIIYEIYVFLPKKKIDWEYISIISVWTAFLFSILVIKTAEYLIQKKPKIDKEITR